MPAEQISILARVLGRNLRLEALTDAAAREEMSKTSPPEFVDAQLRFFAKGEFDDSRVVPTVFEITGRQPRTFELWVKIAHSGIWLKLGMSLARTGLTTYLAIP
jgi:hypothetical protein